MGLVAMTHPGIAGTAYVDSLAFTTVYQPLGWTMVSSSAAANFFPAYARAVAPPTIAIGTSITAASSSNPDRRAYNDWFAWASVLGNANLSYKYNAGVPGNTTTQMLARIQTDVIARGPARCIIEGGTNDAYIGLVPVATFAANIQAMVAACLMAGIEPVLTTVMQRSDLASTLVEQYNIWLYLFAQAHGLRLIDFYSAMIDPTTGLTNTAYTADGLHPNAAGAQIMGQAAADVLAQGMGAWTPPLAQHQAAHSLNLLANALFLNSTSGLATGWVESGSGGTKSIITGDAAIKGNWQRISVAANSAQYGLLGLLASSWTPGDRLAFSGRMSWNVAPTGGSAQASLVYFNGGHQDFPIFNFPGVVTNKTFYLESVVPAGQVNIYAGLTIPLGSGGAATAQAAQWSIYNLTALGIAALL